MRLEGVDVITTSQGVAGYCPPDLGCGFPVGADHADELDRPEGLERFVDQIDEITFAIRRRPVIERDVEADEGSRCFDNEGEWDRTYRVVAFGECFSQCGPP